MSRPPIISKSDIDTTLQRNDLMNQFKQAVRSHYTHDMVSVITRRFMTQFSSAERLECVRSAMVYLVNCYSIMAVDSASFRAGNDILRIGDKMEFMTSLLGDKDVVIYAAQCMVTAMLDDVSRKYPPRSEWEVAEGNDEEEEVFMLDEEDRQGSRMIIDAVAESLLPVLLNRFSEVHPRGNLRSLLPMTLMNALVRRHADAMLNVTLHTDATVTLYRYGWPRRQTVDMIDDIAGSWIREVETRASIEEGRRRAMERLLGRDGGVAVQLGGFERLALAGREQVAQTRRELTRPTEDDGDEKAPHPAQRRRL